jgi:3-oxoacyl-[acyl-carrier-protein] synthase-3
MYKAYIKAISYYLPTSCLTNNELSKNFPDWTVEKISAKTGIYSRHIADENEFASDMAIKASEKLFTDYSISKDSIDFILYCTQSPDYFLPTTACILQNKLGLPTSSGALDFNLGCSGYVYGLGLAKGLICSGIANNVLLITSETYSKFIHPKDRTNRTIFGDASSASLISRHNGFAEILDFDFGTNGEGFQNLILHEGGIKNRTFTNQITVDNNGNFFSPSFLYMNGPEIFAFTSLMVPILIERVLAKNGIKKSEIGKVIFHQANKFILEHLRKKIAFNEEQCFFFLENCGNTVSSTIPIALKEYMPNKVDGELILLAGFGVGYSWGGVILKC